MGKFIEREFIFQRNKQTDVLPPLADFFSSPVLHDPKLISLKNELNSTKSKLDSLDLKNWGRHTDFTNICSAISREVRTAANPEMCTGAFIKMYEMLKAYQIIPMDVRQGEQVIAHAKKKQ